MAGKPFWSEEKLIESVPKSSSYKELMLHLGLSPIGGNYKTMKHHIIRLGLDTSHFLTAMDRWKISGGGSGLSKLSKEEALARFRKGIEFSSVHKKYLPLFMDDTKCKECEQERVWNHKPLMLQVDHIDGDNMNNELENLRYLCPNCHTQTPTFAGRRSKGKTTPL